MTVGMVALIVDASVAVKFVVREVKKEEARRLLAIPDPLIAPDCLLVEVGSALWSKVRRSELPAIHAERHLDTMPRFFDQLCPASELIGDALKLAVRLRQPVYDCLDLALARRESSRVVTADSDFATALIEAGEGERVELI